MFELDQMIEGLLDELFMRHVHILEIPCGPPPKRLVKPVREFLAAEIQRNDPDSDETILGDELALNDPIYRDPFTLMFLSYTPAGSDRSFTGYGMAKRCESDRPNNEYGAHLAGHRAIKDLAQQLVKAGFRIGVLDPQPAEKVEEPVVEIPF